MSNTSLWLPIPHLMPGCLCSPNGILFHISCPKCHPGVQGPALGEQELLPRGSRHGQGTP